MSKVEFKVSAKAARLIGRENITDSTGALLELIKNGYDADAECVYIKLDFKFPNIPNIISFSDFSDLGSDDQEIIEQYYALNNNAYERIVFDDKSLNNISNTLFKYNRIVLLDNGTGMNEETVKGPWMHIGTSNKATNYITKKGRNKTGAKGIGRFALDKLSVASKMITKHEDDEVIFWGINWDQFTDARLLNEISAEFEKKQLEFVEVVKTELGSDFEMVSSYDWSHGTMLILSPTREEWYEKHFLKLNNAIASINPFGYIDEFSVFIKNAFFPQYDYLPSKLSLTKSDYDYKVSSNFDGEFQLSIHLERNEINTDTTVFNHQYLTEIKQLDMEDFWRRPAFEENSYSKKSYNRIKTINIDLTKILTREELITLNNLGPFAFDFFFSKLQNNSDYPDIIKRIPTRKRNSLFKEFCGIRIYRDNFKVRPYGEKGDSLFDWLEMSYRSQRSPAPISHKTGKWRVLPYQTLGSVKISRTANPLLEDVANREGIVANSQYELLVKLCQFVLDEFEYDRQYYYREISKWIKENEPVTPEQIIKEVLNDNPEGGKKGDGHRTDIVDPNIDGQNQDDNTKQYKDAIKYLANKYDSKENLSNILLSFCASGIFTNTFAHEIDHIRTDFATRYDQIELCLDYIFKEKGYSGPDYFDPYLAISDNRKVDMLLSSWISVLMDGFDSTLGYEETNNLSDRINNIIDTWRPLLDNKHIKINNVESIEFEDSISTLDLYTVLNNFILNSIWYLEHSDKRDNKEITVSLDIGNEIRITLFNNGPVLDDRYKTCRNKIFEAGESSKIINEETEKKGTGIGLWISQVVLEENDYHPSVMDTEDGFGIVIIKFLER